MTIPCNKNITKLKNNYTIGITITLQCLLQSTKHAINLVRSALFSASLLVAKNCNMTVYFRISPSGDIRTTLAPSAYLVANPPCLLLGFFFFLRISEFCNEIDEDLDFDC